MINVKKRKKQIGFYSKRYMTILESMIAMSLLSVLLVLVFGFFRELSILSGESKKTLTEVFRQRYVESRLALAFSNIVNENLNGKIFYFFTIKDDASPSPSLIFSFNNTSSRDTYLAGDVIGRLFLAENRLCLAILPMPETAEQTEEELRSHIKIEYLLEDVQNISFKFLAAPYQDEKANSGNAQPSKDKATQPPIGSWEQEWLKEYKQMPVIVKIEIEKKMPKGNQNNQKEIYAFVLSSSKHPITFKTKL